MTDKPIFSHWVAPDQLLVFGANGQVRQLSFPPFSKPRLSVLPAFDGQLQVGAATQNRLLLIGKSTQGMAAIEYDWHQQQFHHLCELPAEPCDPNTLAICANQTLTTVFVKAANQLSCYTSGKLRWQQTSLGEMGPGELRYQDDSDSMLVWGQGADTLTIYDGKDGKPLCKMRHVEGELFWLNADGTCAVIAHHREQLHFFFPGHGPFVLHQQAMACSNLHTLRGSPDLKQLVLFNHDNAVQW